MPSYAAGTGKALYPGDAIALVNNAAIDTGVTSTQQFAVGADPVGTTVGIVVVNTTDKDATGQYAATDADANYKNLSGLVVPSGTALPYNVAGGLIRFTFVSAPTSGSLTVRR